MDFIFEIIFDLILEGSIELLQLRRVPVFVRFLAGLLLGVVYGSLLCLGVILAANGFRDHSWLLSAVGAGVIVLVVIFTVIAIKKVRAGGKC